jgi:hypothetical protein
MSLTNLDELVMPGGMAEPLGTAGTENTSELLVAFIP